jgi:hexosaminidase
MIRISTLLVLACTLSALARQPLALVPQPAKLEVGAGQFTLTAQTKIIIEPQAKEVAAIGEYLAAHLRPATGFALPVAGTRWSSKAGAIMLQQDSAAKALGAEGYELTVTPEAVTVRAPQPAGLFYGVTTLLQLLPPESFATQQVTGVAWVAPAVKITDQPRFAWRGLMLDVSRHFFTKAEVKHLLDAMALHKLNTFHWHLTDDQGWRIEIKKYPQLTQVGAWRKDIGFGLDPQSSTAYGPDGRYGGFYTQDDIREIVAYAQSRYITIVPEIEMPGHAGAALMSYPEFSCEGKPMGELGAGVHASVYCAGRDDTFIFLQNILTEVIALFPGKYVHIGGDEVPKDNWKKCARCQARMQAEGLKNEHELQSYFVRRIEKLINAQGKNLVGWSEIREGGLAANAAVMDWIGGAVETAGGGHDVIMSPTAYSYFDYYQGMDHAVEPRAIGGFLPLRKVYGFEPIPAKLPPEQHRHILGAQGNIWTEYIPSLKQVEYMAFPRGAALAEVAWSPAAAKDWDDFSRRLTTHVRRLELAGVNFRRLNLAEENPLGAWKPAQMSKEFKTLDWDITPAVHKAGAYGFEVAYTKGACGVAVRWAALLLNGTEVARDTHEAFTGAASRHNVYKLAVPELPAGAKLTLQVSLRSDGGTDSSGEVRLKPLPAAKKKQ